MSIPFECIADLKCGVGESPVYDERTGRLYFVDIPARQLWVLDVGAGDLRNWSFESEVASLGLAASGRLIVALREQVILFDTTSEERQVLCTIEAGAPTRLNDGKVGPDGCFWVGTMDDRKDKEPIGALYRVLPTGEVERRVDTVTIANGLAWAADGEVMFFADSRGPWVDRWDFDRRSGEMRGRSRFASLDEATGRPDGGTCDARGHYWSAGVSAGRINRFAPDGVLVESHPLPVPAPTMPCFGGPDFRTLFVTSLREGRPPEAIERAPLSGGLFAGPSPVAGFAPWRFLDI